MTGPQAEDPNAAFEKTLAKAERRKYVLRLYVAGLTPRSTRAVANITDICENHLRGRYELRVIDIYQQAELARVEQIVAVPTLLRELPLPVRRIIGDLSDLERTLIGLDLKPRP